MLLDKLVRDSFAGTIFFTGVVGVVLVSIPCFIWFVFCSPGSFHEGMWEMDFLPIGAVGWLLGTLLGTGLAFRANELPPYAWLQAIALIGFGSIFIGPALGMLQAIGLEQIYWLFPH